MGKTLKAVAVIFNKNKKLGITQKVLAERMGIARSAVSEMLSGERSIRDNDLDAFCEAYGMTMTDFGMVAEGLAPITPVHEGDIIKELREERGWTRNRLSKEAGLRPNAIGELEKNGAKNIEILRLAANALGLGTVDILSKLKEISKQTQKQPPEDLDKAMRKLSVLYATNQRGFQNISRNMDDWLDKEPCSPISQDPKLFSPSDYIEITKSQYPCMVDDDSMAPDYKAGELIYMDGSQMPWNGSIVHALVNGKESVLRIYSRHGDTITLTTINKAHKPTTYSADRVIIQGVSIKSMRDAGIAKTWKDAVEEKEQKMKH